MTSSLILLAIYLMITTVLPLFVLPTPKLQNQLGWRKRALRLFDRLFPKSLLICQAVQQRKPWFHFWKTMQHRWLLTTMRTHKCLFLMINNVTMQCSSCLIQKVIRFYAYITTYLPKSWLAWLCVEIYKPSKTKNVVRV